MRKNLTALLTAAFVAVGASGQSTSTPADSCRWGLVDISVACVRAKPSHASEQTTQALGGTPVRVGALNGDWYEAELPDGYRGYINRANLTVIADGEMQRWRRAPRLIVTDPGTISVWADTLHIGAPDNRMAELIGGDIVEQLSDDGDYALVRLPGREAGYVDAKSVADFTQWSSQEPDIDMVLSTAKAMTGAPYVWGGLTSKGPDCSGLVKAAFWSTGLILRRDASQQALTGLEIDASDQTTWQPGDLLFFTGSDGVRITHVAINLDQGRYIHSSGRVGYGSIYPEDACYVPRKVVKVRRILGSEMSPGIVPVKHHKWYFE